MRKSPNDTRPERRPLRIFAFDPVLSRAGDHRVTVEIPFRPVECDDFSFRDDRIEVVDYDATTKRHLKALDMNNEEIAMTLGLEPLEDDPQFHQQMAYAVASKVLENFDRALGRRLRFPKGQRLRIFPHAFQARNAYFDSRMNAVLFGYFRADDDDPGENLPGQLIFTCLSHDVVAHEVAHAVLSSLQPYYNEPTNPQVPALHEAFADIVAMFQRMTFPEVVAPAIRETRGNLLAPNNRLLDIGTQFGMAAGRGGPLRRIAGKPDPALMRETTEPHDLGWILVSAVYEGFVNNFEKRTRDLVRIATGGSGQLPQGELHPDLVGRLTNECVRTAQAVLSMCIRATDYMPPVDPTFSDFLRAMVTADFELNRADDSGLRAAMIEAFRLRGIRPTEVGSFAVQSLLLEAETPEKDDNLAAIVRRLLGYGALQLDRNYRAPSPVKSAPATVDYNLEKSSDWYAQQSRALHISPPDIEEPETDTTELTEDDEPEELLRRIAIDLTRWAKDNRDRLGLDPDLKVALRGFHPVHRIAPSGELLVEMVAHYVQTDRNYEKAQFGGVYYRAGITLIASLDGTIRYVIRKPFDERRKKGLVDWVAGFDGRGSGWFTDTTEDRLANAFSARAMDSRRWK